MLKGTHSDRDIENVLRSPIKVMVVDHNKAMLNNVSDFLKSRSFEVTSIEDAGAALRVLSVKKEYFDLLLIDSDLRDVDVTTFLRITKDMKILSMVMLQEADDNIFLKMIKNGAFLVIKKPLTDDALFQTRQHVIKERIYKSEQFKMFHNKNVPESTTSGDKGNDDCDTRKIVKSCYDIGNSNIQLLDDEMFSAKKKICLEWTEELHNKFLNVVQELGEGRCLPKPILDAMKVPGLTRMQVASHLQKCREDGWNFNGKRGQPSSSKGSTFSNSSQGFGSRIYGRMPLAAKYVNNQEERNTQIDATTYSGNRVYMDLDPMNNQSFHDSTLTNGFEFQNNGHVFSIASGEQGFDSSLMDSFGLQQVFSAPSTAQDCDSSSTNGFGLCEQIFSPPTSGQGYNSELMNDCGLHNEKALSIPTATARQDCDSSLMNDFELQNGGHLFSVATAGQGCDSTTLINDFGLQNSGQLFSIPSDEQGSSCDIFLPNQPPDDFFDFVNDRHGNELLSCMQLNVLGANYDSISQVIPNEGTSLCTNKISQKFGQGNV